MRWDQISWFRTVTPNIKLGKSHFRATVGKSYIQKERINAGNYWGSVGVNIRSENWVFLLGYEILVIEGMLYADVMSWRLKPETKPRHFTTKGKKYTVTDNSQCIILQRFPWFLFTDHLYSYIYTSGCPKPFCPNVPGCKSVSICS